MTEWRKSSFSQGNGNCVEISHVGGTFGGVLIRDSKDREGPMLRFTDPEWAAFVAGVAAGDFNE